MLKHEYSGPNEAGEYLVTYKTPGCDVPTVAGIAMSAAGAAAEVKRLNDVQLAREQSLRDDQMARGLAAFAAQHAELDEERRNRNNEAP
jgi:mevalonate pyrophosphate decarboxylase